MFNKNINNDKADDSKETLDALRQGSAEAFHLLYDKYHRKIYRFCLRMLGDADNAKDAYQETFIRVYEHRKEFRGNNFSAWLFTIARHTCLNYLRSRKDFDTLDEVAHYSVKETESDVAMTDYIQRALAILPVALREALLLREYEELSYQEIAEVLSIDLSLAKIRVFRAREILRKLLAPLKQELYES
ncbi:MAG: RNA polymerase sigma factor [FCB group bacterium]|jgi:RNA polymerase sigma-70 factor (ECF subfamily)